MKLKEAILILETHNKWRRGGDMPMTNSTELGIAIDVILNKVKTNPISWVEFDFNNLETRPVEYGKYLICRKDGKIHWETWNGSGWAYNGNSIRYWAVITKPNL